MSAVFDATGEKGLLDWSASYFDGGLYKTDITSYNDAYQPTEMAIIVPSNSHTSGLAGTYTYTTTFRADGSPVTETYLAVGGLPAELVTYLYASTGEATSTTGQDLDGTGAPTGSAHPYVLSTTYDALARVTSRQLGDTAGATPNVIREYTYDTLGRLSALTANSRVGTGAPTLIQSNVYTFDANNNIASRQDNVTAQIECFTYDTRNRLTRAYTQSAGSCAGSLQDVGPDPYERTYTFDALSRMTSMATRTATAQSFTTRSYTYAATSPGGCVSGTAATKPHTPSAITNYGTSNFDCAGNMTARTTPAGTFAQMWDTQNRLTQVVKTAGPTSTYIYGPNGQRLIQEDGTTRTLYLPRQEEVSAAGATATAARYYGPSGLMVAARRTGSGAGTYIVGGDNQGSVSWMVDVGSSAVTATRYYPYGEVRGTPNQMPTDHGFVGQIKDDNTGLSYLNNRYYDPGSGVFLSVDPLVAGTGTPYLYAAGSPTTISDPSGLEPGCGATARGSSCGDEHRNQERIRPWYLQGDSPLQTPDVRQVQDYVNICASRWQLCIDSLDSGDLQLLGVENLDVVAYAVAFLTLLVSDGLMKVVTYGTESELQVGNLPHGNNRIRLEVFGTSLSDMTMIASTWHEGYREYFTPWLQVLALIADGVAIAGGASCIAGFAPGCAAAGAGTAVSAAANTGVAFLNCPEGFSATCGFALAGVLTAAVTTTVGAATRAAVTAGAVTPDVYRFLLAHSAISTAYADVVSFDFSTGDGDELGSVTAFRMIGGG